VTAVAVVDQFLRDLTALVASGEAKPATLDYYQHQLGKLLAVLPPRLAAEDVRPIHLAKLPRKWHSHQAARRAFTWGFKVGLLERDPLHGHRLPPAGARVRVPTVAEREAILRVSLSYLREFLVVLWDTGARPGELRNLLWRDVDLNPLAESVTAGVEDYKAKKRMKHAAKVRVLYFGDVVGQTLRRWHSIRTPAPGEHVFLNAGGRPLTSNAVRIAFKKACRRAKIDQGKEAIVPYSFRHGRATELIVDGMPAKLVSEFLGHKQLRTTERYLHPVREDVIRSLRETAGRKKKAA
jgi:integrase